MQWKGSRDNLLQDFSHDSSRWPGERLSRSFRTFDICRAIIQSPLIETYFPYFARTIFQETGATYQYQIGGSDEIHSFVANPNKGAKARMTFAVYGDMGETKRRARKNPMYVCM